MSEEKMEEEGSETYPNPFLFGIPPRGVGEPAGAASDGGSAKSPNSSMGTAGEKNLIDRFLDVYDSEQTRRAYRTDLAAFFEEEPTIHEAEQVEMETINDFLREEAGQYSQQTVRRRASTLSRFFGWLQEEGLAEENPFASAPGPGDLAEQAMAANEDGSDEDGSDKSLANEETSSEETSSEKGSAEQAEGESEAQEDQLKGQEDGKEGGQDEKPSDQDEESTPVLPPEPNVGRSSQRGAQPGPVGRAGGSSGPEDPSAEDPLLGSSSRGEPSAEEYWPGEASKEEGSQKDGLEEKDSFEEKGADQGEDATGEEPSDESTSGSGPVDENAPPTDNWEISTHEVPDWARDDLTVQILAPLRFNHETVEEGITLQLRNLPSAIYQGLSLLEDRERFPSGALQRPYYLLTDPDGEWAMTVWRMGTEDGGLAGIPTGVAARLTICQVLHQAEEALESTQKETDPLVQVGRQATELLYLLRGRNWALPERARELVKEATLLPVSQAEEGVPAPTWRLRLAEEETPIEEAKEEVALEMVTLLSQGLGLPKTKEVYLQRMNM